MSSVADDTYLFSQQGTFDAPFTFTVPATLEVESDSATATFDGSGAGGDFLPCLSFYSPSGVLLARMPVQATPVTAGNSVTVSWFPFAPVVSGGGGGSGIQFDTDNEGGWLDITTNNVDGSGYGLHIDDNSGGDTLIETEQSMTLRQHSGAQQIIINDGFSGITLEPGAAGFRNPDDYTWNLAASKRFLVVGSGSATLVEVDDSPQTLTIGSGVALDLGGNVATNGSPGVNPTDLATVSQLGGGGGVTIVTDGSTTVNPASEIDFTSGAVVTDLGGGIAGVDIVAAVTGSSQYLSSNAVTTIADGGNGNLEWDAQGGVSLLDLTDPFNPVAIAAGVYAVAVTVQASTMTTDGRFRAYLGITLADDTLRQMTTESTPAGTNDSNQPVTALSVTGPVAAGGAFYLIVNNLDGGAGSNDFYIQAAIVCKIG